MHVQKNSTRVRDRALEADSGRAISIFTLFSRAHMSAKILQEANGRGEGPKSEFLTCFKHFNAALDRPPLGAETFLAFDGGKRGRQTKAVFDTAAGAKCAMPLHATFFSLQTKMLSLDGTDANPILADRN